MKDFKFNEIEYVRPDFKMLEKAWLDAADVLETTQDFEQVLKAMAIVDKAERNVSTMMNIAYVRNTIDTSDEFYDKENEHNETEYPTIMPAMVKYYKAAAYGKFTSDIIGRFGLELITGMKRKIGGFNDKLIPFMQRESILCSQYQKIMAAARIPFNGEEYNLYGILKFMDNPDREIRKKAFRAYSDFYAGKEEVLEQIFDELVSIRTQMGQCLGYDDYIPLGYKLQERSDYGPKEVASFREQVVEEIVPLCVELYKAQEKRIGVDRLMSYDERFVFADGNAVLAGDDDFIMEKAREMYHELSPETAEFIDFMLDHELMDLKNRPFKASTGYMTDFSDYKAPFVFSCFNQTIDDAGVLCHELGHAFAGYQAMRHQPIFPYFSESTDIAEIHSMSMEQFTYEYAEKFFGKDADKYRFAHLQEAVTFIPFGAAVDEFQHIIYANPTLSPKERTLKWHELEKKYMPWRNYDNDEFMERGGYWYHKLHIFLYPFYYINYTLTSIGAMEFKKKYETDRKSAWKDYVALCNAGGSLNYYGLLKVAGLSSPFAPGSVKNAMSYVKEILLKQIGEK